MSKTNVDDIIMLKRWWKFDFICIRVNDFENFKRTILSIVKFVQLHGIRSTKSCAVYKNKITNLKRWKKFARLMFNHFIMCVLKMSTDLIKKLASIIDKVLYIVIMCLNII